MALRDIFDLDPRSKSELREELRAQAKVISDLSSQINQLNLDANASHHLASSAPVHIAPPELRIALSENQPKNELVIRLLDALRARQNSLAEPDQQPAELVSPTQDTAPVSDLPPKFIPTSGSLGDSNSDENISKDHLIEEIERQVSVIALLQDSKVELTATIAEQNARENGLKDARTKSNNHIEKLNAEIEKLKDALVLSRGGRPLVSSDGTLSLQPFTSRWTPSEVAALEERENIVREKIAAPEKTILELRRANAKLFQENVTLKARRVQTDLAASAAHQQAAERLAQRESTLLKNFAELQRREALISTRDVGQTLPAYVAYQNRIQQLEQIVSDLRKKLEEATSKVLQDRIAINPNSGNSSELQQQLLDTTASLQHVLIQKAREEDRLSSELTKYKVLSRAPHTFMQEDVLSWIFSATSPKTLRVRHGFLQLLGDGPWDYDTIGRPLQRQRFKLYALPDADVAHLIVGRNNWNESDLLGQIEARSGQELRIYSQEMWFAAMATGRDPFDAEDPDLLLAFAKGHSALEFLLECEFPWPTVSDRFSGGITPIDGSELGVVESPMHLMDYRVGRTSPHNEDERREILKEIFAAKDLMFGDDCSPGYRLNWGTARSAQRLYRMAIHIKFIIDGPNGNDWRKTVARDDWINDLAWLKNTYFRKNTHAFKWPDTHVS